MRPTSSGARARASSSVTMKCSTGPRAPPAVLLGPGDARPSGPRRASPATRARTRPPRRDRRSGAAGPCRTPTAGARAASRAPRRAARSRRRVGSQVHGAAAYRRQRLRVPSAVTSAPASGSSRRSTLREPTPARPREYLAAVAEAGLDHVCCGDHVSFFVGAGVDGLLAGERCSRRSTDAAGRTPACTSCRCATRCSVARQLADLALIAPGRLVFGVGVGGEDPHEVEICGVDPTTRGRRMDESLTILRGLMTGEPDDVPRRVLRPRRRARSSRRRREPIPIVDRWAFRRRGGPRGAAR